MKIMALLVLPVLRVNMGIPFTGIVVIFSIVVLGPYFTALGYKVLLFQFSGLCQRRGYLYIKYKAATAICHAFNQPLTKQHTVVHTYFFLIILATAILSQYGF
jgi:hypothetical protein